MSKNNNIPIEFFEKHLDKIHWDEFSNYIKIPPEFLERHINKIHWQSLSLNTTGISLEFLGQHLNKLWHELLYWNEDLPLLFFEKYSCKDNWKKISGSKNILAKFLESCDSHIESCRNALWLVQHTGIPKYEKSLEVKKFLQSVM